MDSVAELLTIEHHEEIKPLRMARMPISLQALEGALYLPRGYQIVSVSYDERYRVLNLLVSSDGLPEVEEGRELPRAYLYVSVEYSPDAPTRFRAITTEVKVQ